MTPNKALLDRLPNECLLSELHNVLVANSAVAVEFIGQSKVVVILKNFEAKQESGVQTSDRGVMFSREGASISRDPEKNKVVNPRDVIWALYLALQALKLGQGIDPFCCIQNRPSLNLCSEKFMSFTVESDAVYPNLDWATQEFTKEQQNRVVSWIQDGRNKIPNRDLA